MHWAPFNDLDGTPVRCVQRWQCDSANVQDIIDAVREYGGMWFTAEEHVRGYFMPWPPAAVEIRPAPPAPPT